jgi:peptidoglycan-N-acetylglucosamine deacetylase
VIRSVKKHVHNGAIVLSHDFGQPDTIAAYRTLLPWLRKRYQLVALPD